MKGMIYLKNLLGKISVTAILCIAVLTLGGYACQAKEVYHMANSSSLTYLSNNPARQARPQKINKTAASKFSDNDVKTLENSKYNGPFVRVAGNRIYYYKTSKMIVSGHTCETGSRNKQECFLFNSKTVFILLVTHNQGMKVEKVRPGNIKNLKYGCSVFAICSKLNGELTASKVLIMTFN